MNTTSNTCIPELIAITALTEVCEGVDFQELIAARDSNPGSKVIIWEYDKKYEIICETPLKEYSWRSNVIELSEQAVEDLEKSGLAFEKKKVSHTVFRGWEYGCHYMTKINDIMQLKDAINAYRNVPGFDEVVIWKQAGKYDVVCEDEDGKHIWRSDFMNLTEDLLQELKDSLGKEGLTFTEYDVRNESYDFIHGHVYLARYNGFTE